MNEAIYPYVVHGHGAQYRTYWVRGVKPPVGRLRLAYANPQFRGLSPRYVYLDEANERYSSPILFSGVFGFLPVDRDKRKAAHHRARRFQTSSPGARRRCRQQRRAVERVERVVACTCRG